MQVSWTPSPSTASNAHRVRDPSTPPPITTSHPAVERKCVDVFRGELVDLALVEVNAAWVGAASTLTLEHTGLLVARHGNAIVVAHVGILVDSKLAHSRGGLSRGVECACSSCGGRLCRRIVVMMVMLWLIVGVRGSSGREVVLHGRHAGVGGGVGISVRAGGVCLGDEGRVDCFCLLELGLDVSVLGDDGVVQFSDIGELELEFGIILLECVVVSLESARPVIALWRGTHVGDLVSKTLDLASTGCGAGRDPVVELL
jgi:hypothetical protein